MVAAGQESSKRFPPAGRLRRWLFRGISLLLGWGLFELGCWWMSALLIEGGSPAIQLVIDSPIALGGVPTSQTETFHPYVGWVKNPEIVEKTQYDGVELRTSRWGFFDTSNGIFQRQPGRVIVGVCGGSVALHMTCAAEKELKAGIRSIPRYRDCEVILVRMCQAGYKQPQGLMALNYLALQGAEFDIVINLDGYNELALTTAENFQSNVALDYPQGWHVRTRNVIDPRDAELWEQVFSLRGSRHRLHLAGQASRLHRLPSYRLIWFLRFQSRSNGLLEIEAELLGRGRSRKRAFVNSGPHPEAPNESAALVEAVRIWQQSSLMMHRFCESQGIVYLHAIQPNQYDRGSKPLSAEEQENCYSLDILYGQFIAEGYPQLRQQAASLRQQGVNLLDLTSLFRTTIETIYVDPFCHLNETGSRRMARAITDAIAEMMNRDVNSPSLPSPATTR